MTFSSPERVYPESIEPSEDPDKLFLKTNPSTNEVEWGIGAESGGTSIVGGVPVFLLDFGQSAADFETATGFTLPIPSILVHRTSAGGPVGGVPVFLLELGQSVSDYETANSITLPDPAIIARKTA